MNATKRKQVEYRIIEDRLHRLGPYFPTRYVIEEKKPRRFFFLKEQWTMLKSNLTLAEARYLKDLLDRGEDMSRIVENDD